MVRDRSLLRSPYEDARRTFETTPAVNRAFADAGYEGHVRLGYAPSRPVDETIEGAFDVGPS